jgi:hypothetical protein
MTPEKLCEFGAANIASSVTASIPAIDHLAGKALGQSAECAP